MVRFECGECGGAFVNVDGTWRIASRDVSVPRSCLFFLLEDNASSAPAAGGEEGGGGGGVPSLEA